MRGTVVFLCVCYHASCYMYLLTTAAFFVSSRALNERDSNCFTSRRLVCTCRCSDSSYNLMDSSLVTVGSSTLLGFTFFVCTGSADLACTWYYLVRNTVQLVLVQSCGYSLQHCKQQQGLAPRFSQLSAKIRPLENEYMWWLCFEKYDALCE